MPAFHPSGVELGQGQIRRVGVLRRRAEMSGAECRQRRKRAAHPCALRNRAGIQREIAAAVHYETMRSGRSIAAGRAAWPAAVSSALFHSAAVAFHGTVTARG